MQDTIASTPMKRKVLVINPGGTSTKIALYDGEEEMYYHNIISDYEELKSFAKVFDQIDYRLEKIRGKLEEDGVDLGDLCAVVGRGGLMKPIAGGTYTVCENMISDMKNEIMGEHASNLGAPLAKAMGDLYGVPSFVVDPVAVDEFMDISRITGLKEIDKPSWLHSLNQKAVCRKIAREEGRKYEEMNFIVAHLGSGNSTVAHKRGRMVDGSGGRSDGPFSPERPGGLLSYPLAELCYSGKYDRTQMINKLSNEGGFYSYLGTKDMIEVEKMAEKDGYARTVLDAYYYQIAKEIAMYTATLGGEVDFIILTGGIAHSDQMVEKVSAQVSFIAPVRVVPGELEMIAMAQGALRVLDGEEEAKDYGERGV